MVSKIWECTVIYDLQTRLDRAAGCLPKSVLAQVYLEIKRQLVPKPIKGRKCKISFLQCVLTFVCVYDCSSLYTQGDDENVNDNARIKIFHFFYHKSQHIFSKCSINEFTKKRMY